jgi:Carboxypeptidase regulatory-like domain
LHRPWTRIGGKTSSTTPNIDFALALGGSIAGTVTNTLGTPIAGVSVNANSSGCCGYGYATTAPDGTYLITGLIPDTYRVQASGPYCPTGPTSPPCVDYVSQYYSGTYDWSTATLVPVTSGVTTPNINFTLAVGGRIAGTVTNTLGTPIAEANVYASLPGCCGWGNATSAADGTYTITGLPPGSYRVQANGPYCPGGVTSPPCVGYAAKFYDNTYDSSSATLVAATSGSTTTNINFALELGGSISGKVIDALGTPVAGAWMTADRNAGAGGGGWATTGADGTYVISGLAPGSDVVSASVSSCPYPTSPPPAGGPCTPYPVWFYNGVCEYLAATPVPVISGGTASNINITLRAANPDCLEHAVAIGGLPFTDTRGTAGATTVPGESLPCGNLGATVWYEYTAPPSPPASNTTSVDTVGSNFNTAVAVYSEGVSPPGILTLVGCKASGSGSLVHFTASPGAHYFFQIGGQQAATGQLVVNVSPDTDGDGYTDIEETRMGKNPAVYCKIMRADVDYDGKVSILDLAWVAQWFTQNVPPAPVRFDQDGDHKISVLDLAKMAEWFTQPVSACP